ncbi:hypothetical protein ACMD2_14451 [Ananas comosus]|uniref:Uncharacterized protein n=1 Tax=Ananas comosus TaxID=4615 RepID=A0A199V5Y3_ANACO|nr:hypothetical protein ACMD2_14451 [Ananas comosus]
MSLSNPNPSHNPNPRITGLLKQRSWSPDSEREEAWLRRKGLYRDRRRGTLLRRSRSVTDEDLDELRGCFDLGFGFDPDRPGAAAKRLAETIPALDLFYAVHRTYGGAAADDDDAAAAARSSPSSSDSPVGSPLSILSPGDSPEMVKMRLKHWAQVVAWSVRQRC